jgi:hypothetical protein
MFVGLKTKTMITDLTPETFIDTQIKSVELVNISRGKWKVQITWNTTDKISYVFFSNKKSAKSYYDWITGNPKHPLHIIAKENFFNQF